MSSRAAKRSAQKPPTGGELTRSQDETGRDWTAPRLRQSSNVNHLVALGSLDFLDPSSSGVPIKILKEMEEFDETISSAIEFVSLCVIDMLGPYVLFEKNKKIQDYCDSFWLNSNQYFDEFLDEWISGLLTFGHATGEIVARAHGDLLYLDEIVGLDPSLYRFVSDSKGNLVGIDGQICPQGGISKDRLIIGRHKYRYGNHKGRSRLGCVYKWWALSLAMTKSWSMALDLHGMPITVARIKNGENLELRNGIEKKRRDHFVDILKELRGGSSLVLSDQDEVVIQKLASQVNTDFEGFMNFSNKMKLRGLLLPATMWEPTDVGSFALGKKQFEIFLRGIARLTRYARRVIEDRVYRPFIKANYGSSAPLGRFVGVDTDEDELKVWAEVFYSLVNSGFLKSSLQDDLDAVRDRFKLPKGKASDYPDIKAPSNGLPGGQAPGGSEGAGGPQPRPVPRTKTKPEGRPKK